MIQSAKNAKTAKPNKTEDKINHFSIFPSRKQTICTVTQHTGGGGGGEGGGKAGSIHCIVDGGGGSRTLQGIYNILLTLQFRIKFQNFPYILAL